MERVMARPFDELPTSIYRLGPPPDQARAELLLLPEAWVGSWYWQPWIQGLAGLGYGVNLVELPGHGQEPWTLPAGVSLLDYTLWAARSAGNLAYPILVGHGLGAWLVQKLLEVVDLPCLLMAPWPAGGIPWPQWRFFARHQFSHLFYLFFGRALPPLDPGPMGELLCQGADISQLRQIWPGCAQEPPGVMLDFLLGLSRPKPESSELPRLVIGFAADRFINPFQVKRVADNLEAQHLILPGSHIPWWGPEGEKLLRQADKFLGQLKRK
jgi:hypothetical protein